MMKKKNKLILENAIDVVTLVEIVAYKTGNDDMWYLANRLMWEIRYTLEYNKKPIRKKSIAKLLEHIEM